MINQNLVMGMTSVKVWELVVPFTVMVMMEGCTIALTIWAKTAITNGISPFVFVIYTHALSSLILLLYSFVFHSPCAHRRQETQLFSLTLLVRFFLLGLTGITISQNLGFLGLSFSSPIVVCAMGLMIPAFSFFLSVMLRSTKVDWRSSSFQAKVSGTIISVMGAIMVELYKGPYIRKSSVSSFSLLLEKLHLVFSSAPEHWVLGGILLAAASFSVTLWNIIQLGTMKLYPELEVMEVASFYSILGTIQCAILSLFIERNPSAWRLKLNMDLLLIILTAAFGGLVRSRIHNWCMKMKGPYYVPLFKPFGIVFATVFGVSLSANSLHCGSVVGAVVIGMGYFIIMWGQMREDEIHEDPQCVDQIQSRQESNSDSKVPLLQDEMSE